MEIEFRTKLKLLIINNLINVIFNRFHLKVRKTNAKNLIFKCSKNQKMLNKKK